MNDKELGARIGALRWKMTLKEFSLKCGLPYHTVRYLSNGEGFPIAMPIEERRDILKKITAACGVSEDYLLADEEPEEHKHSKVIIKCAEPAKTIDGLTRFNYFCVTGICEAILSIAGKRHFNKKDAVALRKLTNVLCYILDPCIENEWQIDTFAAIDKERGEENSHDKN